MRTARWRAGWRVKQPGSGSAELAWLSCTHVDRGGCPLPWPDSQNKAGGHARVCSSAVRFASLCKRRGGLGLRVWRKARGWGKWTSGGGVPPGGEVGVTWQEKK